MFMKKLKTKRVVSIINIFVIVFILSLSLGISSPKKVLGVEGIADFNITDISELLEVASTSVSSEASAVVDQKLGFKELYLDKIAKQAAKMAMKKMTAGTVNWINSGFKGRPVFLENPSHFFTDIAKQEITGLVQTIAYNTSLYPFGRNTAKNIINNANTYFRHNAQSSLNKAIGPNWERYYDDFSYGGWSSWMAMTQYPQNNPLGFEMMVEDALSVEIENSTGDIKAELLQGGGFLSLKKCTSEKVYDLGGLSAKLKEAEEKMWEAANNYDAIYSLYQDDPSNPAVILARDKAMEAEREYDSILAENIAVQKQEASDKENNDTCAKYETTTPGGIAASQISEALGSPLRQLELADEFEDSLAAVFDALIAKLVDTGLSSLSAYSDNNPYRYGDDYGAGSWLDNPDEIIDVDKELPLAIDRVEEAIDYYKEGKKLTTIQAPLKVWGLDVCLPGPDKGWEGRFRAGIQESNGKVQMLKMLSGLVPAMGFIVDTLVDLGTEAHRYIGEEIIRMLQQFMLGEDLVDVLYEEYENLSQEKKTLVDPIINNFKEKMKEIKNIPSSAKIIETVNDSTEIITMGKKFKKDLEEKRNLLFELKKFKIEWSAPFNDEDKKNDLRRRYSNISRAVPSQDILDELETSINNIEDYLTNVENLTTTCQDENKTDDGIRALEAVVGMTVACRIGDVSLGQISFQSLGINCLGFFNLTPFYYSDQSTVY